jgi:uncharacterized membrane protein
MMSIIHWIYIGIALGVAMLLMKLFFEENRWKHQIAIAMILIPIVLRVLHIK